MKKCAKPGKETQFCALQVQNGRRPYSGTEMWIGRLNISFCGLVVALLFIDCKRSNTSLNISALQLRAANREILPDVRSVSKSRKGRYQKWRVTRKVFSYVTVWRSPATHLVCAI